MKVAVVGAGFAGIAAAIDLQERGHDVVVLERRGILGGRATSFQDSVTKDDVDNGTHIMVGAYEATLDLARRAGATDLLDPQANLRIDYVDSEGFTSLRCPPLPAPLHLVAGILGLRLPFAAKLDALRFGVHVKFGAPPHGLTLSEYFHKTGQGREVRRHLWAPLARAIVNERPEKAAAILFYNVYRQAFLRRRADSTLVFLRVGFARFHDRLAAHFTARGGAVRRRAAAQAVVAERGRIRGLSLVQGLHERQAIASGERGASETIACDAVVLAVPPRAVPSLLPETVSQLIPFRDLGAFGSAPIVSVELWLDRIVVERPMVGLRSEEIEWVFDKGRMLGRGGPPQHLSLVVSAAHAALRQTNGELVAAAEASLRRRFPLMTEAAVTRSLVLREPDATFSSRPELEALRPGPRTPVDGLFLAGDWTDTGLPATIEGAVRSGFRAASCLAETMV